MRSLIRLVDSMRRYSDAHCTVASRVCGRDHATVGFAQGRGDAAKVHQEFFLDLDLLALGASAMNEDARVLDRLFETHVPVDEAGERLNDGGRDPVGSRGSDRQHRAVVATANGGSHIGQEPRTGFESVQTVRIEFGLAETCLLYTSDAADDLTRVDLGGRRI